MKNILLATDLSGETDRAFERAIQLASTLAAKLHILHVFSPAPFDSDQLSGTLEHRAKVRLENYLSSNQNLAKLQPSVSVVENREPFIEIINNAEKVQADLIVMGMHGKSRLRDLFVGTTIEKVIRKGTRPVLMVKDKPLGEYKHLLVGTDFSVSSGRALKTALQLVPNGSLDLVHLYAIPDTYIGDKISQYAGDVIVKTATTKLESFIQDHRKDLEQFAEQPKIFQYRVVQGETFIGLSRESKAVKADIIAIGVHSQASILPYRIGGIAREILVNPPCDVLVAKPK